MYSNAEILASVVTRWTMPIASSLLTSNLSKLPFLDNIQAKVKSTGWVSAKWCVANELVPFAEPIVNAIVTPAVRSALSNIPDEQIPMLAHGIVSQALQEGSLAILDGRVTFDKNDLERLKRLLDANLPISDKSLTYQVKEDET